MKEAVVLMEPNPNENPTHPNLGRLAGIGWKAEKFVGENTRTNDMKKYFAFTYSQIPA